MPAEGRGLEEFLARKMVPTPPPPVTPLLCPAAPPSPPQCWACPSQCLALASALPLCQPLSGPVWGQMAMWASCQRDDYGCCTWGWAHFPGTCGGERSLWEEEQEPDEQEWDEAPDGQESRSFKLPRGSPPPHSSPPVGAGTVRQVVLPQGPVDLSARVC